MKKTVYVLFISLLLCGCNENMPQNQNKNNSVKKTEIVAPAMIPDTSGIDQTFAYRTIGKTDDKGTKVVCDLLAHLDDFYSFQASVHKLNSFYIEMGKERGENNIKYIEVNPKGKYIGSRKELKRYRMGKAAWTSTISQCDEALGNPIQINNGERHYRYRDYEIVLSFKKNKMVSMGIYHQDRAKALEKYTEEKFVMQGCRVVKYTGNYDGEKVDLPTDVVSIGRNAFAMKKSKEPSAFNEYNKNQDGTKVKKISVCIPPNVHIEPRAFYKSGPIEITLEEGRTDVEPYAFANASWISQYGSIVHLPKTITRIREGAFWQDDASGGEIRIFMGENVKKIDDYALRGTVFDKLPDRVESLGNHCIRIRYQKEKLVIPQHVKKLGYNPITLGFRNEEEKQGVSVHNKNAWFKSDKNGWLYSKDGKTLYFTYATKKSSIPASVKKIKCELFT